MSKKRKRAPKRSRSAHSAEPGAQRTRRSAPPVGRRRPPTRVKRLLFAAVAYVAFFVLVELALFVAGVPTLIEKEDPFRGFSGLVSVYERDGEHYRTRPASTRHTFNDQSFLAEKPANGLRIFGLGGSSAFGFPWGAEAAFPSILGEALAERHPELHVEAVNASGTSYAMHRLNIVADELLGHSPDVFVVYSGHNEFVEPAFFEAIQHRSRTRNRLEFLLANTRTYSALRTLLDRARGPAGATASPLDVDVRRDETRSYSPAEKAEIVAGFREGLTRLVARAQRAGVRVVLVTVPANLREWQPEASRMDESLGESERQRWSEAFLAGGHRLRNGQADQAAHHLEQAAALAPDHAETQFLLARAYERLGRRDEARRAYVRACDADASPIRRISGINQAIRDVARERGVLLVDADRIFSERSEHGLVGFNLIEDYVHPTREGHEIIAWHVLQAIEEAGGLADARPLSREAFDALIAERRKRPIEPNAAWFYNQGVILADQGRIEAAIEKYREAIRILPDYEAAMLNLGALLGDTGRSAEAVPLLQRLVEIDPSSSAAHLNLGAAQGDLGRFDEAALHFREALRLNPQLAHVHRNLGVALQQLGRDEEAEAAFRAALRVRPDDAAVHYSWGNGLSAQERYAEAISHYREALRLQPDFADAQQGWGAALTRTGSASEAIAHLREAARLQPADPTIRHDWGIALWRVGRLDDAAVQLRAALRLWPGYADAHESLAGLLSAQGDPTGAEKHLALARQLRAGGR